MNFRFLLIRDLPSVLISVVLVAGCDTPTDQVVERDNPYSSVRSLDGVPIMYDDFGQGSPAIVLVHGWSCDRSYWSEQVGPLSLEHRVINIDIGGHGQSGLGRENWTIASFGADVAAVVENLDLDSVVLVGHSMGGDVIFQAAKLLPGQVDALIMVDTYKRLDVERSDDEIDEIVAQFSTNFPAVTENFVRSMFPANTDPALVERVALDMASAPPDVALSAIRSSLQHAREVPSLIRDLGVPVVAINPDDAPTDLDSMNKYEVNVEVMHDVGHFLMMEDPARFNGLLLEAIDEFN